MSIDSGLIRAQAGLTCLLSYDSVWSGYTKDPRLAEQDPFAMFEIALAFREELGNAERYADHVYEVATDERFSHPSESLINALASDETGRIAREVLGQHDESVAALARSGLIDMREAHDGELGQLEEDAHNIVAGQLAAGLFGDRFLCGLAKASMAAGLITVWVPPHVHAAAAVGLGATVYKTAKCGARPVPRPAGT